MGRNTPQISKYKPITLTNISLGFIKFPNISLGFIKFPNISLGFIKFPNISLGFIKFQRQLTQNTVPH